jgi:hypothetical protein
MMSKSRMKRISNKTDLQKPYDPTSVERVVMDAHLDRKQNSPKVPGLKIGEVKDDGVLQVGIDHSSPEVGSVLLMDALGLTNTTVLQGFLQQLINTSATGQMPTEAEANFMLKSVIELQPRDHVEAMLASQMVVIQAATMTMARRLAHVETLDQQNSAERALNKLARTFATQVEALKRYQTGGEQKVVVEHVTVNSGGQAVVGEIHQGGGGRSKNGD